MAKFHAILLVFLIPFSVAAQQPRNAKDFSERGIDRYTGGEYEGAIADFTMEIRLSSALGVKKKELIRSYGYGVLPPDSAGGVTVVDPRTAGAYLNRGNAFFATDRIAEAIQDYDRLLLSARE